MSTQKVIIAITGIMLAGLLRSQLIPLAKVLTVAGICSATFGSGLHPGSSATPASKRIRIEATLRCILTKPIEFYGEGAGPLALGPCEEPSATGTIRMYEKSLPDFAVSARGHKVIAKTHRQD